MLMSFQARIRQINRLVSGCSSTTLWPTSTWPALARTARLTGRRSKRRLGPPPARPFRWSGCALRLLWNEDPQHQIDDEPGASQQGEHHEQHPDQRCVGVEVLRQSAAHAGQLAIGSAAVELAGLGHGATLHDACLWWRLTGVGEAVSMASSAIVTILSSPWRDPPSRRLLAHPSCWVNRSMGM